MFVVLTTKQECRRGFELAGERAGERKKAGRVVLQNGPFGGRWSWRLETGDWRKISPEDLVIDLLTTLRL